ncbi:HAD family hydrolase [Promethearchaeum syntrophicum]|uniref:HAD family hydrolase n=1 Tax=Promethearchaeum syntrophicum TaxID=2594042 RepID=A0A5B9D6V7_9ARCH|nr:HAD family hydrolase [Candidatus Prometheoarchaeum syntrophicum]QEE14713.1 putative HAD-hydrolase [Candidatus Prometheoarchaeum syntrophicum]
MIKAIFFDFGGTLFDFYPSNYQILGSLARRYGIDLLDTDNILSKAFQKQEEYLMEIFQEREKTEISILTKQDWNNCDQILLDTIGVKKKQALPDLFDKFQQRMFKFQIYPDTIPTLKYLKKKGFFLGIISNLNKMSQISLRYKRLEEYNILNLWDVITLSGEIGISKPHPEIFLKSLEKLNGITPNQSIYVGDSYIFDVLGARKAGMIPVLLDSNLGKDYDCLKISSFQDLIPLISKLNNEEILS